MVTAQVPRPLQSRAGGSCVEEVGRTSCGKGGRRAGSSIGLLIVAIFVSSSSVIGTAGGREDAYGPRHSAG